MDPYQVLDISIDASEEDIKAAYKRMAKRWHPDRHVTGKEIAAQHFIEGHEAFRRLMDKKRYSRKFRTTSRDKEMDKASPIPPNARRSTRGPDVDGAPAAPHLEPPATNVKTEEPKSPAGSPHQSPSNVDNASPQPPPGPSVRSASGSKKAPSDSKIDDPMPRPRTDGAYSTPCSPITTHRSTPPAGSFARRSSGSNLDAKSDRVPRPKTEDAHSAPSSPAPVQQSHTSDRDGADITTPNSPKPPSQRLSRSSQHPDLPEFHAEEEKQPSSGSPVQSRYSGLPSASSARSSSAPRKPPSESKVDGPLPDSKTEDAHSAPSSPKPSHQSIPPQTSERGFSNVPEMIPSSPRPLSQRFSRTSRHSDLPEPHTQTEKRSSSSGSPRQCPSNIGRDSDFLLPSNASARRASGSKKAASESKNDNPSVHAKTEGGHSMLASPTPIPADEMAAPNSPKFTPQNCSPSSRKSELSPPHATIERLPSSSELLYQTPPNVSRNSDLPSPSASSTRSASTSRRAPSESVIDRALPRSNAEEAHSMPSSPEPINQLLSSPASIRSGADLPETTPDSPKSPAQKARSRLQKYKRRPSPNPDPVADDYVYITQSKDIPTEPNGAAGHYAAGRLEVRLCPIRTPLSPSKWLFPLELTLEELFHGTSLRFRITSRLLSRDTKQSLVEVDIPPGTLDGTKIRCPGVGHQNKEGTFEDVILVVRERPHDRFQRDKDDLFLDVFVPYADQLVESGDITVEDIDGTQLTVHIPYPAGQNPVAGTVAVKGAGMPYRTGRGDLIIRWEVVFPSPTSKWDSVRKVLHMPC